MERRSFPRSKVYIVLALLLTLLPVSLTIIHADSIATDFESYATGTVHNQNGWSSFGTAGSGCAVYDHYIVNSAAYGFPSFGARSLRISNGVATGCFGDQTFSMSLADESGESGAANAGKSGGTRQPFYQAQWDFASTVPGAEQVGLVVAASADRGDGARQTWVGMDDTPTGLQVRFIDYPDGNPNNFVTTTIASGLDRTVPHTIRMSLTSVEGPVDYADGPNDIVCIWVDNVLKHQGTSWETYHRAVGSSNVTVDSVLFRTGGTSVPANLGNGFLIDNFSQSSGAIPAGFETGCTPPVTPIPPSTPETPSAPQPSGASSALTLCALLNGGTNTIVRANANPYQFCRILVENGQFVQNAAEIGDANLINMGIQQAVDVFEFTSGGEQVVNFSQPLTMCLLGAGQFYYRDASGQPRTTALLPSWQESGYTCASIPHAGTVILAG